MKSNVLVTALEGVTEPKFLKCVWTSVSTCTVLYATGTLLHSYCTVDVDVSTVLYSSTVEEHDDENDYTLSVVHLRRVYCSGYEGRTVYYTGTAYMYQYRN